jgi:subfamily B ATP-binding cassette protein MsbA
MLVILGILMFVSASTATAQIIKYVVDDLLIKQDKDMLVLIPLGLIGIYIIKALGGYIQKVFMEYIGLHIITRVRNKLLKKMIFLDMDFIFKNRSGDFISRITNDIDRIRYFATNMLPDLTRESLTVVTLVAYVIWLNPLLAFYALILMPIAIYPLMLAAKRLKKLSKKSQEKNSDIVSRLTEVFNNSEIIKANATEKFELDRFNNENWKFFKLSMKSVYTNALISPLLEIIGASGLAAVIYVGGMEVYSSNMTAGEFTAFLTAVGLVFQPIRRISSIYGNVQDAIAATERIIQILDLRDKVKDGKLILDKTVKTITFENTALYYNDLKALDDINLTIKAGDNIALVGDSGGGKSSMLNLLLRFYDADEGKLLINNEPIQNYTQKSLRHQISIVSQRVYIFQDTLAQNVAYGEDVVDEKKVIEALTLADAIDFVNELEDGIHTVMSEVGSNLSGGQRQRIAIARAIYKHASLLLFDEATSALDNKSEKRIQDAIDKYSQDKITITIAHRLSTVKHADKILVFKKGMIVDSGTHIELIQNSSEYKRLSGVLA